MTEQRPPIYPGEWLSESPWIERQGLGGEKPQKPIEVTRQMVTAGQLVLISRPVHDDQLLEAVYLAMRALEPKA